MKVKRFKRKEQHTLLHCKRSENKTIGVERERNSTILTVINFKYEHESVKKQQIKTDKFSTAKVPSKVANRRKVYLL